MAAHPREQLQADSDPYRMSGDISLYLFACRIYYLRFGNLRAHAELVSAEGSMDPEVRTIAESLLADCVAQDDVLPPAGRRSEPACQTCCS